MRQRSSGPSSERVEKVYQAYSSHGGAGGYGTKISIAGRVGSGFSSGVSSGFSSGVGSGFSSGIGSGFSSGSSFDYHAGNQGSFQIGNEKATMNHLNDRLASYLETVRNLEKVNQSLEIKIREAIANRGPNEERDYSKFNTTIMKLRAQIFELRTGNAQLAIQVDNASLAADDFKLKLEYEVSMRMAVEADVNRLRKILDDTNVTRLHLETDIEGLKEELITLRKNHKADVADLRGQISHTVQVDVDAPKGQDLAKIMEEMRETYEKIALKNQRELQAWHESQITEVQVQVTENTVALKEATTLVTETRRRWQALEIELQSQLSLKGALEASLRDIEARNNMEMERYNGFLLKYQAELTQIRTDIQQHMRDYEILLNIKMKLEAEIAEYRRLLDGGVELKIEDALHSKTIQTKVVTIVQTLEDGKVVSESKDVKASAKVVEG